jgi:hypothetical protein
MLKFSSGADSRHFFFHRSKLGPGLASLGLNLVCLAFLWSQSFNSFVSSGGHRSSSVNVTLLSNSMQRGEVPVSPTLPTEKPNTKVKTARDIASENNEVVSATATEQSPAAEEPAVESPPAITPSSPSTDNAAFAIPNQLEFPFSLRRRGLFESSSRTPQSGPPGSGNSLTEQQWRRQNAQADSHREMMVNILSELNKQARPNTSMTCQTRPKVVCSADYEPAFVILRRYEGFFTDPNLRENFSFRFTEGRWSVDSKASP